MSTLPINTPEGFKAFSGAQFELQHDTHAKAAQALARAAVLWLASASDAEPLTDAECIEIDAAVEGCKAIELERLWGTPYGSQP